MNVTLTNSIGGDGEASAPQKSALDEQVHNNEYNDSANSTSSHKDSSSDDEFPGANNIKSLSSSDDVTLNRSAKYKSRRDRDRKRKRYELNYTSHRPKLLKATDSTITSSRNEESSQSLVGEDSVPENGQQDGSGESKTIIAPSAPSAQENIPENENVSFISKEKNELVSSVNNDTAQLTPTAPSSSSTTIDRVFPSNKGE